MCSTFTPTASARETYVKLSTSWTHSTTRLESKTRTLCAFSEVGLLCLLASSSFCAFASLCKLKTIGVCFSRRWTRTTLRQWSASLCLRQGLRCKSFDATMWITRSSSKSTRTTKWSTINCIKLLLFSRSYGSSASHGRLLWLSLHRSLTTAVCSTSRLSCSCFSSRFAWCLCTAFTFVAASSWQRLFCT